MPEFGTVWWGGGKERKRRAWERGLAYALSPVHVSRASRVCLGRRLCVVCRCVRAMWGLIGVFMRAGGGNGMAFY